ncbi:MAG: tRNA-binding protein [Candidatus Lloydbacteria bacterium RIFCSPHIGHO2_02_FULL_51_22]|uniref:tRNA-binding protein n=2 Tax=Candidatus Lloydiibacteriota TaxID=1817910 RepID=A0A1G2DDF6_9BACT|nr:MAG: tRNA-binding protein [Candidatus Lloydbacteria bacterium RIFCSPHIGHO2_02_FULL_51_22]OGZ15836.1 MAG: tRNA-binding protein [Candidatus Lloydbacteria bacterium RIFCSPLOWO2_12_FULL_51_9]
MASIDDFQTLDIRVGKIVEVNDFPEAKKPAYKLKIDFGTEIGIKNSSVQIVALYAKDELVGKLVLGVVNFPPRKIGPFESEVLTLGIPDAEGKVILITPDKNSAILGGKLF